VVQGIAIGFTPADFRDCSLYNALRLFDWRDGISLRRGDREKLERVSGKLDQRLLETRLITAFRKVSRNKAAADAFNRNANLAKMKIESLDQLFIAV
jgi:hypothetical protein